MRIVVRYFAVVRERLRREEEMLELPEGANVGTALDALGTANQPIAALRPYLRAAVNQTAAGDDEPLHDGDELALIPPVAGGARLARMVGDRAPSVETVMGAVRGPGIGGVVAFVGLVRNRSQGKDVERLEYEAYVPMAEKVFVELCEEIEREHPGVTIAVEHRTGKLGIGDIAVAIAVGAPHRGEAFRACEKMIDRLKQRAPIWKKEFGPDGGVWVGLGP
jgi:MoaE-MoaD fusion protein